MAKLRFFFGTMGSGKSTQALQIHHNLRVRGRSGVLLTQLDRRGGQVSSRLGVAAEAIEVRPGLDLAELLGPEATGSGAIEARRLSGGPISYAVADEAQFYEPAQVEQLASLVDRHGVDVYGFGLLTSFQGRLFPGTVRWLELADERSELQVEARCWCGDRATHNARLVNGVQTYEGDVVVVGDTPPQGGSDQTSMALDDARVTYELMCRAHWSEGEPGS
ncbi:MAG: thymidine kinase [Microthrixaceae bacterium]